MPDESSAKFVLEGPAGEGDHALQSIFRLMSLEQGAEPYALVDGGVLNLTSRYPYKKIDEPSKFRLLRLFPKSFQHPMNAVAGTNLFMGALHGELIDANLSEETPYDCLSYTWGTGPRLHTIWLDSYRIAIADNLYRALCCLRKQDEPRLVWVDFVCINQQDLQERKQQVDIMFQIYQGAEEVVVDLGAEADGSEKLPGLFEQFDASVFEPPDSEASVAYPQGYDASRLPPAEDAVWHSFRKLIERPWFTRVWIIQEAVAAKKLSVICGNWSMSGSDLFLIIGIAMECQLPCLPKMSEGNPWENAAAIGYRQILLLHQLGVCKERDASIFPCSKEWGLLELLERSRHAGATDPRDRVFAFLNLCKEKGEDDLAPDYTETVTETYMRLAKFAVSKGDVSRLLCNAFLSDSKLNLPSWVPDWSFSSIPFENIAPEAAREVETGWPNAGGKEGNFSFDESCNGLTVEVYGIDEITDLGPKYRYRKDPPHLAREEVDDTTQVSAGAESADSQGTEGLSRTADGGGSSSQPVELTDEEKFEEDWAKYPVLFRYYSELCHEILHSDAYSKESKADICWRTMICDREVQTTHQAPAKYLDYSRSYTDTVKWNYFPGALGERIDELSRTLLEDDELGSQVQSPEHWQVVLRHYLQLSFKEAAIFSRAASRLCYRLRYAMTNTGYVGMVPHRTEAGDFVVIIKGVCVPMVIRRVDGEDTKFRLVGQAYFHGFMSGEILQHPQPEFEPITLV